MPPRSHHKLLFPGILLIIAVTAAWGAQKPGPDPKVNIEPRAAKPAAREATPRASIRVDSTLVLIPVTVTDPMNRFVTGLEKENFRVFEDKSEQQLVQLRALE
ncbi:MAG: hypothetical protein M1436_05425, partial [Acidobacteria bacterium]|nr:hypothetical protein [Acidobacteriota bacterium]